MINFEILLTGKNIGLKIESKLTVYINSNSLFSENLLEFSYFIKFKMF